MSALYNKKRIELPSVKVTKTFTRKKIDNLQNMYINTYIQIIYNLVWLKSISVFYLFKESEEQKETAAWSERLAPQPISPFVPIVLLAVCPTLLGDRGHGATPYNDCFCSGSINRRKYGYGNYI